MQTYKNDVLGFNISYPDHWSVVPAAWIKKFMGRAAGTSEKLSECLAKDGQPFLVAHDPSAPVHVAIPSVKCQAYIPAAIAAVGGITGILSLISEQSQQAFPDFKVLDYVPECLIAGVKGARMATSMTVLNPEGEEFHGKSDFYFLPTSKFVFLVAVSGTSDPKFRPEQELMNIVRSIRLEHT